MDPGAFVIQGDGLDDYDIQPRGDLDARIPEEQRELQKGIYRTRGILKHLEEQGVFRREGLRKRFERRLSTVTGKPVKPPDQQKMLGEFKERLRQIAETGLTGDVARVQHAADAHEDLQRELLLRKGNAVKYHYLAILAGWAAVGLALGWLLHALGQTGRVLWDEAYGLLVMGAVVGAWLSVAATRWSVAFEDLPDLLDSRVEPFVRMLFVVVLALALGVALRAGLLTMKLGDATLNGFVDSPRLAVLLGLVTGIGERALATRFIEGARTLAEKK